MSRSTKRPIAPPFVVRFGRYSLRAERRATYTCLLLTVAALVLAFVELSFGSEWSSPSSVLAALGGRGDEVFVITNWRLPRVVAAIVFGAALALGGAIFQNLTNNPLGSPDIIGLDAGAYTGALIAMTVLAGTSGQLAACAIIGGLSTALIIYWLSLGTGRGTTTLIVVGIAANAMLTAVNSWIVLRSQLDVAISATAWSAGSLNGLDWDEIALPMVVIAALVVALMFIAPAVHQSTLGADLASTSGVALRSTRMVMVLVGVGCTAIVTAVAGPIIFIALAAPQIGKRLAGSAGVALVPAALTGAVLLLAADLLAQITFAPKSLPVGVVTTAIGGTYLLWLLTVEMRRVRRGMSA